MKTFRSNNNNRRHTFRRNDRGFQRNDYDKKFNSDFTSSANSQRGMPSRNNQNASKLTEKYNDLAREALSNDDKILAENYLQYADHFVRVLNEQVVNRVSKIHEPRSTNEPKGLSEVSSSQPKKLSEVFKSTKPENKKTIEPSKTD